MKITSSSYGHKKTALTIANWMKTTNFDSVSTNLVLFESRIMFSALLTIYNFCELFKS